MSPIYGDMAVNMLRNKTIGKRNGKYQELALAKRVQMNSLPPISKNKLAENTYRIGKVLETRIKKAILLPPKANDKLQSSTAIV